MKTNSYLLMNESNAEINYTGTPVKVAGYYRDYNMFHTISIFTDNLNGRIYIEGTLKQYPEEKDWFIIPLEDNKDYIEFKTENYTSERNYIEKYYNINTNAVLMRARLDRNYLNIDTNQNTLNYARKIGHIRRIYVAF